MTVLNVDVAKLICNYCFHMNNILTWHILQAGYLGQNKIIIWRLDLCILPLPSTFSPLQWAFPVHFTLRANCNYVAGRKIPELSIY